MSEFTSDFMAFLGDDVVLVSPETEETVTEPQEEMIEEEIIEDEEEFEEEDELDAEEVSEDDEEFDDEDELEDEEAEEEEEQSDEIELTIEGEVVKVTKEELSSGYMRSKDYLKKVAEAEERVERLKAEEDTLLKSQQVFSFSSKKQLSEFEAAIEAEGGWLNIERTRDPVQVAQFKEMYQNVQNQAKLADTVEAEYKEAQAKSLQKDMEKVAIHLVKTVPNITREVFDELDNFTNEYGLDPTTIRDPNAWVLIHKAMMYDKAQVKKVDKSAEAPKPAKRVKKTVATRKEQPVSSGHRSLNKKISELKNTRSNKERNSEVARSAIADILRMS